MLHVQSKCGVQPSCYWLPACRWAWPDPASNHCPVRWSTTSIKSTLLGRWFFCFCLSYLGLFASVRLSSYIWLHLLPPLQAGHNFHNVDFSYVQRLCGTMLKGPKLPVMWVSLVLGILAYECNRVHFFLHRRKRRGFNVTEQNSISEPSHYVWKSTWSIAYITGVSCSSTQ